jgi:hypothetical protein
VWVLADELASSAGHNTGPGLDPMATDTEIKTLDNFDHMNIDSERMDLNNEDRLASKQSKSLYLYGVAAYKT